MTGLLADFLDGYEVFWPVMWLLIAAGVAVSIELGSKDKVAARMPVFFTALTGVVLAIVSLAWGFHSPPQTIMGGGILIDQFGTYMSAVILAGTAIACFTSLGVIQHMRAGLGDFMALILVAASGMLLLAVANDLIMVFLSIELMSLAVYVLCGLNQKSARSAESAMKYFVMGSFASGFLVMGMALLYGLTGQIQIGAVANGLAHLPAGTNQLALLGAALVVIGFVFKIGAVPFHQWVPDVYTGAPTPVTGLMSVAVKTAAFTALVRMLAIMLPAGTSGIAGDTTTVLWVIAAATMLFGNWLALVQENVKRMLAYSSVAHSGYLLMALTASQGSSMGVAAVMFYLLVYTFGTAGAFAVLSFSSGAHEIEETKDLRGLGWKRPFAAAAMTVFMLSLAGIPLTGGFVGKYYLFSETLGAAKADSSYYWLVLIGIAGSLLGAFYYLRVVVLMYMKEPSDAATAPAGDSWGARAGLSLAAIATLVLGLKPSFLLDEAKSSVQLMHANTSLAGAAKYAGHAENNGATSDKATVDAASAAGAAVAR
jgi:NADH-quinone oxidoreductase subunit N